MTGSSIYEFFINRVFIDDYFEICKNLFYIDKDIYHLFLSELNWIDSNLNLNDNRFNNLKFNIFIGALEQFVIKDEIDRFDFTNFVDINNPPNSTSIKFPIYMAVYLWNKLNNQTENIIINFDNLNTNMDKVFKLYTLVDTKTFTDIYDHIDKVNFPNKLIRSGQYSIDVIFDESDNFMTSVIDYELNINNIIHHPSNNNLDYSSKIIEVFGGGYNNKEIIKIPVNPFDKVVFYVNYMRKNIDSNFEI